MLKSGPSHGKMDNMKNITINKKQIVIAIGVVLVVGVIFFGYQYDKVKENNSKNSSVKESVNNIQESQQSNVTIDNTEALASKEYDPNTFVVESIYKKLISCEDQDPSTAGVGQCISDADNSYNKEIDRMYIELNNKLDEEQKKALKQSQDDWVKFRDSEFDLITSVYSKAEGTMWSSVRGSARMDILKNRALELSGFLDGMNSF